MAPYGPGRALFHVLSYIYYIKILQEISRFHLNFSAVIHFLHEVFSFFFRAQLVKRIREAVFEVRDCHMSSRCHSNVPGC